MRNRKVTLLNKLDKLLHDRQKELIYLIANNESIEQEDYITTAHYLNELVVEKVIKPQWYNTKENRYQPKLTPRGNFYYKEYLFKGRRDEF